MKPGDTVNTDYTEYTESCNNHQNEKPSPIQPTTIKQMKKLTQTQVMKNKYI